MPSPLVIAHRGASKAQPENTIAAFATARELGADWVELDVRRTADGSLIVHHDAALADGRVIVELAAAALPPHVPALTDALDACAGVGVNIEIKNSRDDPDFDVDRRVAGSVSELLASRDANPPVLISSFDWKTIERVRAIGAGIETAWLVHTPSDLPGAVARCGAGGHEAFHPWAPTVDESLVAACHDLGLRVNTWTVDDPEWMRRLAEMGVDGIVTNVPDVARLALG
jgi:glycerophosphoryl diester phosphodiesterase